MNTTPLLRFRAMPVLLPILYSILFISCLSTGYTQDLSENATIADINSLKDDIAHRTQQDIESSNALEEKRWLLALKTNVTERVNALSIPGRPDRKSTRLNSS